MFSCGENSFYISTFVIGFSQIAIDKKMHVCRVYQISLLTSSSYLMAFGGNVIQKKVDVLRMFV